MTVYRLNNEHYIFEEFEGDYILLNKATGLYFECAENAALLFKHIVGGVDFETLAEELNKLDTLLAEGARATIEKFQSCALLIESGPKGAPPEQKDLESYRPDAGFIVEGHDDLAAYILADPVHDLGEEIPMQAGTTGAK